MYDITLFVAIDLDGVIGRNGAVPWRLSRDMRHFAETTTGYLTIMGRKTWDSLPEKFRPLPNRTNVVLTRDTNFQAKGCLVFQNHEDVLKLCEVSGQAFVIGGAEIYNLFLPFARRILMTEVNTRVENGDTFFPRLGPEWKKKLLWRYEADAKNDFSFWVIELTRDT